MCSFNSQQANAISIKPADFERLIKPCYTGTHSNGGQSIAFASSGLPYSMGRQAGQNGQSSVNISPTGALSSSSGGAYQGGGGGAASSSSDSSRLGNTASRDVSYNPLGQQIPRASTVDNFISLVTKIEAANPRLANNIDQLIVSLLDRFRLDNYYYDARSRMPLADSDARDDILPALLNSAAANQQAQMGAGGPPLRPGGGGGDYYPEPPLDHEEKCSMYFMLSHFIDKSMPLNQPLSNIPITQLTGSLGSQKPPNLQAAGSGYPAQSADYAYGGGSSSGGGTGSRYPGPAPSFGSPQTQNMNSFGGGISNTPDYSGKNPYGMNSLQPNAQFSQNLNNLRQSGAYPGSPSLASLGPSAVNQMVPVMGGQARQRDEKQAIEYGVVTVANQDNAAIVLNRVLLGILAANSPPQTIRQVAANAYPATQSMQTNTPKLDDEIDPLYAVTLADLWAVSSLPKPGKPLDLRLLGDNGRWNDTMCPTAFHLERSSSIRFTTAELLGGLDGFNLGLLRRRMMQMRMRSLRLSELLRMYYSKAGFRPQFAEVNVCMRGSSLSTQYDDLRRQAESYLRLLQLNVPTSDNEIAMLINRLESFRDITRQAAQNYAPQELCQETSYNDIYPSSSQDQCEIAKTDVVAVLDASPMANNNFMNLVVTKLAQRLGLSRYGSSLSVLTNQQDTTGYAGSYSFNAIVRNSTNTAEIGCALAYDTSRAYQGGQITDPTRLIEMFERALVNVDSEYIVRQNSQQNLGSSSSYSYKPSTYVSSLSGYDSYYNSMSGASPRNSGGSKVVVWFNYGQQARSASLSSNPTNWYAQKNAETDQYKFQEAKKFLRENYRGASILAVGPNRDDLKAFVFDEDKDLFTDIPNDGSMSSSSDPYGQSSALATSSMDPQTLAMLSQPAEQLVNKLMTRMCDIPSLFQYPLCFREPSINTQTVGYISPGRRQNWMMSPKTFFASRSVRMVWRVEGGRLRVCFGRMQRPDESFQRSGRQYQSGSGISFTRDTINNPPGAQPSSQPNSASSSSSSSVSSSSSDYYTGLEHGICKDLAPGQEIDFVVSDPCYKKAIADCEPFYYVVSEINQPGEGDPNYMCKDEGCKRFDQVRFTMSHTGVACSSALSKYLGSSSAIVLMSIVTSLLLTNLQTLRDIDRKKLPATPKALLSFMAIAIVPLLFATTGADAQQSGGVFDYGQGRYGERRGSFTPAEWVAIVLLTMTILAGLALTIGLCYYVAKRTRNMRGLAKVPQEIY